jgi:SAM-dependent methyltransferase
VTKVGRSEAFERLLKDVPLTTSVIEVGCGSGRNLAYLAGLGYSRLAGVEISPHAVEVLRDTYPELKMAQIFCGPAEEVLPTIPDEAFDLLITMGFIEAIHPDNSSVFDDMARIGRALLLVEADEAHRKGPGASSLYFPYDARRLFNERGYRLTSQTPMREIPGIDPALNAYFAYRFERVNH